MKQNKLKIALIAASTLISFTATSMQVSQNGQNIVLDSLGEGQFQLKVGLPSGEVKTFEVQNNYFVITPALLGVKSLSDGQYKYELTPVVASSDLAAQVRELNDEQLTQNYIDSNINMADKQYGVFTLQNNLLLADIDERSTLKSGTDEGYSDQQILDDLIVDGSACVGLDCVNGESFGFDTLRLKENNLRINFQDTSNSGSFPTNDWRIVANDTSNGGANYLAIEDSDAGRIPFRVEAGARSNALVVESDGDIGIGTLNPAVDLQITTGNTPTLRLEQDGSSGFQSQTWDVAGNEANFFVRDVTNGSKLSFRIRPGAPESSIDIAADGDIGMGTSSPQAKLHVVTSAVGDEGKMLLVNNSTTKQDRISLHLINNGKPQLKLENSDNSISWILTAGNKFILTNTNGDRVMDIDEFGNMRISGTLTQNHTF